MSEDLKIKAELREKCHRYFQQKLYDIKSKVQDLQEALGSETKSSAGDKHETSRAMIHLEREKIGFQLAEIEQNIKTIERIDTATRHKRATLGSVVFTTQFNYFIAASCGQQSIGDDCFYVISAPSPIAKQLIAKEENDSVEFRGEKITILKIL